MMRALAVFLLINLAAASGAAEDNPADRARLAADRLQRAASGLTEAQGARDRVRALTATVQAYESGLAAMRAGLRDLVTRESQLARRLKAREHDVSRLLGVIQTIETAPPPILMLHPAGPQGAARSGMMLADVTPGLQAHARTLRRDLDELRDLRIVQEGGAKTLAEGLAGVQLARAELSRAVADRTDLPRRFVEDPVRTAILLSSTETLGGFAEGLSELITGGVPESGADAEYLRGRLGLPLRGVLLHKAGEADAAGIRRQGMLIASRPQSLVTAPLAATIRYSGPLLDLGNVLILEPQADTLFVFAGLGLVYAETGQVVQQGAPLGMMGGAAPEQGTLLSTSSDDTGTERSETLYIEVREGNRPVDPETWFRIGKDG